MKLRFGNRTDVVTPCFELAQLPPQSLRPHDIDVPLKASSPFDGQAGQLLLEQVVSPDTQLIEGVVVQGLLAEIGIDPGEGPAGGAGGRCFLFEKCDLRPAPRKMVSQRSTEDSSAHDHNVVCRSARRPPAR